MVLFFSITIILCFTNRLERNREEEGEIWITVGISKMSGRTEVQPLGVKQSRVPTKDTRVSSATTTSSIMPHCLSTAIATCLPLIGRLLPQNMRYVPGPFSSMFCQPLRKACLRDHLNRMHNTSIPNYSPRSAPTSHESQIRRYAPYLYRSVSVNWVLNPAHVQQTTQYIYRQPQ